MKKASNNDSTKFVPSIKDWEKLYSKWFKRLVGALWKSGRIEMVEDAVQDAFLKLAGLSENRQLRSGLEPLTETGWYCFLKQQAEWILGQEREKSMKWKSEVSSIKELTRKIESVRRDDGLSKGQRELSLRRHCQLMRHLVDLDMRGREMTLPSDGLDGYRCREVARRLVANVCRDCGISDRNRDAFVLYVLDEESPAEVVARIWGAQSSLKEMEERKDNLYVIKNRIYNRLRDFAAAWRGGGHSADEFLAVA